MLTTSGRTKVCDPVSEDEVRLTFVAQRRVDFHLLLKY